MKMCKVCRKKPRFERKLNSDGVVFCSQNCYENWKHPADDYNHPYVDAYEGIRLDYIRWLTKYEEKLMEGLYYGYPKKADLLEQLDEVLETYVDFEQLEGRDGVYSVEIYRYIQELDQLKGTIECWQVDDRKYTKWHKRMTEEKETKRKECAASY